MRDTVNPKDIFQDVVHNFSSRYRGYAQYHNVQVSDTFALRVTIFKLLYNKYLIIYILIFV